MPIATIADFPMDAGQGGADGRTTSPLGPGGIYHEKQIGQMCAVHAMNNLLQGPLFQPDDLYQAAHQLDQEEKRIMGGQDVDLTGNARMDGFFNVQVIRVVLQRMGYVMDRIKSEEAKDAMKDVAKEKGYILNKREHWFAIRRLGEQEWFDLNSCMLTPKHYTNNDLHHVINDAIRENYEVFVVRGDFPKAAIESEQKSLLEAIQGCGHANQGHALFVGSGETIGGGGGSAPKSQAEIRAARLAKLGGGSGAPATSTSSPVTSAPYPAIPPVASPPATIPKARAAPPMDAKVETLMGMGFPEDKAKAALVRANGNIEQAAELLLTA